MRHDGLDVFLDEGEVHGGLAETLVAQGIYPVVAALKILKIGRPNLSVEPLEMSLDGHCRRCN